MKFLSGTRTTFETTNYNPPPGYYNKIEKTENNVKIINIFFSTFKLSAQKVPLRGTFPKANRFNNLEEKFHPGYNLDYQNQTGFDKIAFNGTLRSQVENDRTKSNNFVYQTNKLQRRKTVGHKQTAQDLLQQMSKFINSQTFTNINEGLSIQQKQQILMTHLQALQNQTPGPGHYDSKIDIIKPNIQSYKITSIKKVEIETDPQSSDTQVGSQLIWGKGLYPINYEKNSNTTQKSRRPSTHDASVDRGFMLLKNDLGPQTIIQTKYNNIQKMLSLENEDINIADSQSIKKSMDDKYNNDFNLELLLAREKRLPPQQQVPPPGWYYSEECFSQFGKLKEKSYQNQCFDSRQPRFEKIPSHIPPGPGEYETKCLDKVKTHLIHPDKQNKKDIIEEKPCVGDYDLRTTLFHKRKRDIEYPAIFGSSTKRDIEKQNDVPGPGSYNVIPKRKRPLKFVTKKLETDIHQKKTDQDQQQVMFGLAVTADLDNSEIFQIKGIQKSKKQYNKQSSAFSSTVQRFNIQNPTTSDNLGPGVYQVSNNFIANSYNTHGGNFTKGYRNLNLTETKSQTNKSVGPGTYDANINVVRQTQVKDIKFL